jgi:PAS domain S-box-containing protein
MTTTEILANLTRITLVVTALVTLVDLIRHRDRARLDIHMMFAGLAIVTTLSQLTLPDPILQLISRTVGTGLLVAHPYFLLRLVAHFRPVPRLVQRAVLGGLIVSLLMILFAKYLPKGPAAGLLLVAYFLLVEGYAITAFVAQARATRGVSRWRCGLAASGSLALGLVLFVIGLNVFLKLPKETLAPFNLTCALAIAGCYFVGFAPPRWVRRSWQLGELHRFLLQTMAQPENAEDASALDQLCSAATDAVGGVAGLAVSWDDNSEVFRVRSGNPIASLGAPFPLENKQLVESWKAKKPVFVPGPFEGEMGRLLTKIDANSILAVPIATVDFTWGLLLVAMRTGALFPQDDLALLAVMAEKSAHAVKTDELQARYRVMLQSAPFALIVIDHHGLIVQNNVRAEEFFGYSHEEFGGVSAGALFAGLPEVSILFAETAEPVCLEGRRKNNSAFPASVHISTLTIEAQKVFMLTIEDITVRRKAEEEIVERSNQLRVANQELEAFSYSVSHDLRAPLRAIDGFSRILEEDFAAELSPQACHYLKRVRDNACQMGNLIDDLLDFSRLGRKPLRRINVSTVELVERVVAEANRPDTERPVAIAVGELPDCDADPTLLKQVLINLISNAIKFSRKSSQPQVAIGWEKTGDVEAFYVRDNGVGFDMAYAPKLFGVFQRLHRADEYEGTGVGLAIVRRIVERHGGAVWADAKLGMGATFYFTLKKGAADELCGNSAGGR